MHDSRVVQFLSTRVPSEKIARILEIALRSDIIAQTSQGFYIPRPRKGYTDKEEN